MSLRAPSTIEVRAVGDRWVVEAVGDLDLAAASALRHTLHALVMEGRVHVVVDLRQVAFVDSSGLGVLVAAQRKVRAFRGSLVLVTDEAAGPSQPARVLRVTGLDRVLRRVGTLGEAVGG